MPVLLSPLELSIKFFSLIIITSFFRIVKLILSTFKYNLLFRIVKLILSKSIKHQFILFSGGLRGIDLGENVQTGQVVLLRAQEPSF